jgi:hypothetical protein
LILEPNQLPLDAYTALCFDEACAIAGNDTEEEERRANESVMYDPRRVAKHKRAQLRDKKKIRKFDAPVLDTQSGTFMPGVIPFTGGKAIKMRRNVAELDNGSS